MTESRAEYHGKCVLAIDKIREILWPNGNMYHEWASDEIEEVARVLLDSNLHKADHE